jgi:hypothetical protein
MPRGRKDSVPYDFSPDHFISQSVADSQLHAHVHIFYVGFGNSRRIYMKRMFLSDFKKVPKKLQSHEICRIQLQRFLERLDLDQDPYINNTDPQPYLTQLVKHASFRFKSEPPNGFQISVVISVVTLKISRLLFHNEHLCIVQHKQSLLWIWIRTRIKLKGRIRIRIKVIIWIRIRIRR